MITRKDAPPRTAWTVAEVATSTGLHPDTVRKLIHEGRLRAIRAGARFIVPVAALDEYLASAG